MKGLVEVREFQVITSNKEYEGKNNYKFLPEPAFSQLIDFIESYVGSVEHADAMDFMRVYKSKDRKLGTLVSVNNYVGLVQLKSGYQVQILPKIDLAEDSKKTLIKMLKSLKDLPGKISSNADLKISNMNLYEIYINMYLNGVYSLLKHGMKSAYVSQEDNLKFYKGKLRVNEQIKYNFAHQERFFVSYDEFLPDRPENRLVKSTLLKLKKISSSAQNIKEINRLISAFDQVSISSNFENDFSKVIIGRNTQDYKNLMKWSKVFLFNKSFTTFAGNTPSRAILFPMEQVYESFVAKKIKKAFKNWSVSAQDREYYLFEELNSTKRKIFGLIPDIVIRKGNSTVILDTKWKRLIPDIKKNYGITSADMYQMYVYAMKYAKNNVIPEIWLLYPMTNEMKNSFMFESNDGVKVNVFFVNIDEIEASLELLKSEIDKITI